ncbi:MAG: hypothetical protein M1469_06830 [Bacteroidetes bacterium]|nr:hypothetical protein [Bacteroidota bacterium]
MSKLKTEALIAELEEAAAQLGLKVIYEKGDFSGGYCILKEEKLIVINKRFDPKHRASTIARSLVEVGTENVFLKPAVREYVEEQAENKNETSSGKRSQSEPNGPA